MELVPPIVLDANVLISAVLGVGARRIVAGYAGDVWFCTPDVAFADAHRHLQVIASRRRWDAAELGAALSALDQLRAVVHVVDKETYETMRDEALSRIGRRDADDWPILATALVVGCPVWTEDRDFFGAGVSTWTTDRVELYLSPQRPPVFGSHGGSV